MFEVFLFLLFAVSVMTSLFVEGIKKFIGDNFKYSSNILAGIVAVVLSILAGVFYCILAEVAFTAKVGVFLIALMLLSWLCAMVGYDKVVQAIRQLQFSK